MELNNNTIQDLMKNWIIFRDESLSQLTKKDKEHLVNFDTYTENILRNVPPTNKKYVEKQFDKLNDKFLDYIAYWNDKYYRAGFGDCLNLVIMSLGGNNIATK